MILYTSKHTKDEIVTVKEGIGTITEVIFRDNKNAPEYKIEIMVPAKGQILTVYSKLDG